jgi:hypothetical protein
LNNKIRKQKETMKKIQLAIMAAAMVIAVQARASLYDITFTGGGSTANGQIDVVSGLATSGFLTITAGPQMGTYALLPGGPGVTTSPLGNFNTDSQVFTAAPTFFLDSWGLLFTDGTVEINMWGNSPGNYSLWGAPPQWSPQVDGGTATLTAVPEASTMIAGALLLLPFGASTLRILRRKQTV